LRCQSAISSFTRTVTVAQGVFAPGHLGELTQFVPFEVVDGALTETGAVEQRLRLLSSRVGVYFVLALGLYGHLGYLGVWDKLVAGLRPLAGLEVARPSEKALRDLRRRLGVKPFTALFALVAGPLAAPGTPGVRYRRWRTVAFDGCSSIKVPDSSRNGSWLGKVWYRCAWAGYPTLMLMALVETGTRGLLGAVTGPTSTGEINYARRLLDRLNAGMLVLADRGFDGNDFLAQVAATGAQLLIRAKASRRPPVLAVLPDGSFLSRIGGLNVRVIDADVTVTTADGTRIDNSYRLLTTLLDHRAHPAATLIGLYHERWEIESAFYALRHTLMAGRVLRSRDPVGLEQELWALLVLYQLLRTAMVAATDSVPGTDPDRASFTIAMEAARDQLITAEAIMPTTTPDGRIDLVGTIGRRILADLLPPRRPRLSARKVKSPISRYNARATTDNRPLTSTNITTINITIKEPSPPTPPATPPPGPRPRGLRPVLTVMATDPDRTWHATQIADALGETNINSIASRLSRWASKGLLTKTDRATYRLLTAPPIT